MPASATKGETHLGEEARGGLPESPHHLSSIVNFTEAEGES